MGSALPRMTLPEFLAWENEQVERNEFVNGEVYAMVGARRVHLIVVGNAFVALKQQLRGTRCRAFTESAKLQVGENILYPDVLVTCDPPDLRTEQIFRSPSLVIEVLSPSTEGYNRGLKFALYRSIASLREYLLVHPDTLEVTLFRRGGDGLFTLNDCTGAANIELHSVGCTLSATELFEGLEGPSP